MRIPAIKPFDVARAQPIVKYNGIMNGAMNTCDVMKVQLRFTPDSMIRRPYGMMLITITTIHQDLYRMS